MKENNIELAELLRWKIWQGAWTEPRVVFGNGRSISLDFHTDHNSMSEVCWALRDRGLWDEFLFQWIHDRSESDSLYPDNMPPQMNFNTMFTLLNDLSGQVVAAIRVLRNHR